MARVLHRGLAADLVSWLPRLPAVSSQLHSFKSASSLVQSAVREPENADPSTAVSQEGTAAQNSSEDISDHAVRGTPWVYNFSGVEPDHKAAQLSVAAKETIWQLHNQNPIEWTVEKLAEEYRIRRQRVHAILWLKDIEKEMEKEQGGPLDDTVEKQMEALHESFPRGGGEKHVTVVDLFPGERAWEQEETEETRAAERKHREELSAKEEEMLLAEFVQRMNFNKRQIAGQILLNKMDRRRPKEGWSYVVEELGEVGKRGKRTRHRAVASTDGTKRPLNELEKDFQKRETVRPRRRLVPR